jgi:F0F1-type ATP synthase membrane subunit b/b'
MTKSTILMTLLAMLVSACGMFNFKPAADPAFKNMHTSYQSQIKSNLSSVDSADSEFQGALEGVTPEIEEAPAYKSLIGKYDAIKGKYEDAQGKAKALLSWAAETEPTATEEDRNKLSSEASALQIELRNIDSSMRALVPDLQRIQTQVGAQIQAEKNIEAIKGASR